MVQGRVELVSLICHLRQAHMCRAGAGHGWAAGRRSDHQRSLVGAYRRVQTAPSTLHLAKVIVHHHTQAALADLAPLGAGRGKRTLGFCESAA